MAKDDEWGTWLKANFLGLLTLALVLLLVVNAFYLPAAEEPKATEKTSPETLTGDTAAESSAKEPKELSSDAQLTEKLSAEETKAE